MQFAGLSIDSALAGGLRTKDVQNSDFESKRCDRIEDGVVNVEIRIR